MYLIEELAPNFWTVTYNREWDDRFEVFDTKAEAEAAFEAHRRTYRHHGPTARSATGMRHFVHLHGTAFCGAEVGLPDPRDGRAECKNCVRIGDAV